MHTTETHAVELLVTDTIVYEIVGQTPKTISLRRCRKGDRVSDDAAWPLVYSAAIDDPNGDVKVLRLRKDGTFRSFSNSFALHFTSTPVFRTDYSF